MENIKDGERENFFNSLKVNTNVFYNGKIHTITSIDRENKKVTIRLASSEQAEETEVDFGDVYPTNLNTKL